MSWTLIAVLILVGLLFIVLEILVIPGQGLFGVLGLIVMGIGIWQTYGAYGNVAGHIVLASSFVASVVSLVLSLRSKTWGRMMLNSKVDGKVNVIDEQKIKVGDIGKSVSRLVPAGKAMFSNEFYEKFYMAINLFKEGSRQNKTNFSFSYYIMSSITEELLVRMASKEKIELNKGFSIGSHISTLKGKSYILLNHPISVHFQTVMIP